jgi:2-oxo-3-hexenedioate decarboxylase
MNNKDAAQAILNALASGKQIEPLTASRQDLSRDDAYDIANRIHRTRLATGDHPLGRKIGFTNRTIWEEYGVHEPILGYVYEGTVTFAEDNMATLGIGALLEPRIEPEIVLRFDRKPPTGVELAALPSDAHRERAVLDCVEWLAHGFEIVQSPYPGWKFAAVDTMAAFGLHGSLVVGTQHPAEAIDDVIAKLRGFKISLSQDAVGRARGGGALVLGSPLLAYAHLAQLLDRLPQYPAVEAGEIVTTGTLTPALPIRPGETWSTTLTGIELPGLTLTSTLD